MIDCIEIAFPDDNELILEGIAFGDTLSAKGLILYLQQILYSGVLKHCCRGAKVKMLVGVLDLHVDNTSIVF